MREGMMKLDGGGRIERERARKMEKEVVRLRKEVEEWQRKEEAGKRGERGCNGEREEEGEKMSREPRDEEREEGGRR